MIDIHSHLLFGIDDGSPDLDTSVRMARMAAEDGITHMVCTPHASSHFPFSPETTASRLADLRTALSEAAIPLTLGSGCDFHMSLENVEHALVEPRRYAINGTEYLLIELPDFGIPPALEETLYRMQLAGITPILTHPERNATLQRQPEKMAPWLRNGLLVQVTANAITGGMGKHAQQMAERFLRDRWVHIIATDTHNLTTRPPVLSKAHAVVAKQYGSSYANLLCHDNPLAVFEGRPLPAQEEPLHLYDDSDGFIADPPWWKRIFGFE